MNEKRLTRMAGVAAIAGIVLIAVANIQLGNTPKAEDPAAKVLSFITGNRTQGLAFGYLFGIGLVLLTFFGAELRRLLRRAGDSSALPDLVLAATVWIAAADMFNVGAVATAAFRAPALDARMAQVLFDFSNLGFALLGIPFAVLFGAAAFSAMSTRAFPRWIGWLGVFTALINLSKPITMFARNGSLAPGGGLTLVALIPIWVWTIAVGMLMIKGKTTSATPTRTASEASSAIT